MSRGAVRRLLWATLVCVAPLPFFLVETGAVPVLRILLLAGIHLTVIVVEGAAGAVAIAAALLLGQALVYLALLWLAAGGMARLLCRGSPRGAALATALVVLACVGAALASEPYRTPFRSEGLRAGLLEILD